MNISYKKIFPKYIGFLLIVSVIPLLAVGIISYHNASQAIQDAARRFSTELLNHKIELLESKLDQVESLIVNISSVEAITNALDDEFSESNTYTDLATQAKIGYILNGYLSLQGLVSIDIFTSGGTQYHVGDSLNVGENRNDIRELIWQETLASPKQIYWSGILPNVNKSSSHKMVLGAAKIIKKIDHISLKTRPIALILVSINIENLNESITDKESDGGVSAYLIDQRDNIAYSHKKNEIGQSVKELFPFAVAKQQRLNSYTWNGNDYFIQSRAITKYNWQIFSLIPQKNLRRDINRIGVITFYLVFAGILLTCIAGWYFSHNIVQPIKDVITAYKGLQNKTLKQTKRLPVRSDDEVGELVKWFNTSLDNLEARELYENALRESEERYALVANATNEGLWDWNITKNEMYFSPRFFALLGKNVDENSSLNTIEDWYKLIHPKDIILVKSAINDCLNGKTAHFQCEYRLLHHDGRYRWILSRGLAIWDSSGEAIRMAASHSDISDQRDAKDKLRYDAFHDSLTGLYNRSWFVSYLQELLSGHSRNKNLNFAVLFLDLDQFKLVNDTLGHAAGDKLLIYVAERLKKCLRETDMLARFGGDEFVILLKSDENYRFIQIAERIIEQLSLSFSINNNYIHTGASIGITLLETGYQDAYEMLRDADIAMYRAKLNGKNCHIVFDEEMRSQLLKQVDTEKLLRQAIENDELTLYYQPIISLSDGRLTGFEALLRWNNPILGNVSPDVFIPLAEANGTIIQLGQWVFESAFIQLKAWKEEFTGFDNLVLSINMSPVQFLDKLFLKNFPKLMDTYNIKGSEIAIEITETAIIHKKALAIKVINDFKKYGIHIHLDDFGTGYSSISHLVGFQIDLIKIDRSFIELLGVNSKEDKLVQAIINFAHNLGIKCTAEGIEEAAQQRLLSIANCDYAQGYFIAKPAPASQLTEFIREHLSRSKGLLPPE
ncbi:diguanylate cyclase/phosphodiesterase with PAS/PAC and GAF sensor(s) [Psychromonas ingrahamii 37]|uniref:Diguanylate cyclase/phosphodiesterase with PAS/PAC and GAF sensor(S) n=1 Tax=Psychromonas ingrahamii (strain DSM 17664 / CCUG 51855 / 37) TaxID=357804 RepID=A1STY4_PSYIN|nr:EAL domain-containing protein [Psychromonas ingrahamii]ABM02949.1 diguanylate cyclase/phosphodiesterase with PAS/PAC and GAF sensor(s) [Psychromonas ingrahamii 37]